MSQHPVGHLRGRGPAQLIEQFGQFHVVDGTFPVEVGYVVQHVQGIDFFQFLVFGGKVFD